MYDIRVLAFTASYKRPIFLRCCMLQIQSQAYTCSHGVFINSSDYQSPNDSTNYMSLINDINISKQSVVKVGYGKTGHQHFNHMAALLQFDIDNYDLFLKIDDDDIYSLDYVKNVVEDYQHKLWDFSAVASKGFVNKTSYEKFKSVHFGHKKKHDILNTMPGTYAFTRKAIKSLIDKGNDYKWLGKYEDNVWLKWMKDEESLKCSVRDVQDYVYIIHENNFCSPKFK